jgi:hypothetical protein
MKEVIQSWPGQVVQQRMLRHWLVEGNELASWHNPLHLWSEVEKHMSLCQGRCPKRFVVLQGMQAEQSTLKCRNLSSPT